MEASALATFQSYGDLNATVRYCTRESNVLARDITVVEAIGGKVESSRYERVNCSWASTSTRILVCSLMARFTFELDFYSPSQVLVSQPICTEILYDGKKSTDNGDRRYELGETLRLIQAHKQLLYQALTKSLPKLDPILEIAGWEYSQWCSTRVTSNEHVI